MSEKILSKMRYEINSPPKRRLTWNFDSYGLSDYIMWCHSSHDAHTISCER